jgi:hypothetical protein
MRPPEWICPSEARPLSHVATYKIKPNAVVFLDLCLIIQKPLENVKANT